MIKSNDTPTNAQKSIEALIAETEDPNARVQLLVLSNIYHALDKNIEATQTVIDQFHKHREKVETHIATEQKLIAGIRWAWWTGSGMGVAILSLASIIIIKQMNTIDSNAHELNLTSARLVLLEAQVIDLQRRQNMDDERRAVPPR